MGLFGFHETVQRLGGNPDGMFVRAGFPSDVLKQPDQLVNFQKYCKLLELAGSETRRDFGIQLALDQQPNFVNIGPIVLLSQFEKTAGDCLRTSLNYFILHTNGFKFEFIDHADPGLQTIRYHTDSFVLPARQVVEHAFACLLLVYQQGCKALDEYPTVVRFQHAQPDDTRAHDKLFGCPIEWGAAHSEIIFEKRLLAYPTAGRNLTFLRPLMSYFIRRRIDKLENYDQSASTNVLLAIPSMIGTGHCKVEDIAAALGTNVKALQRQLSAEKTTFSELLDRVRENLARNYLLETKIPVSRIADLLEYSGTAPFITAFHRWTGMSPLKFRQGQHG